MILLWTGLEDVEDDEEDDDWAGLLLGEAGWAMPVVER
jgi:hypothetical protein